MKANVYYYIEVDINGSNEPLTFPSDPDDMVYVTNCPHEAEGYLRNYSAITGNSGSVVPIIHSTAVEDTEDPRQSPHEFLHGLELMLNGVKYYKLSDYQNYLER